MPDSYDNTTVLLSWLPDPVEINRAELELPQFELMNWKCERCEEVYRTGGWLQRAQLSWRQLGGVGRANGDEEGAVGEGGCRAVQLRLVQQV